MDVYANQHVDESGLAEGEVWLGAELIEIADTTAELRKNKHHNVVSTVVLMQVVDKGPDGTGDVVPQFVVGG